jgi:hypothetical protein
MKLRWHRRTIVLEAARSAAGLLLFGAVSALNPLLSPWQIVMIPLCALFASHLFGCAVRLSSTVSVDDQGIKVLRGWLPAREITWTAMNAFEIRIFSLGRYRKGSLADMKLRGPGGSLLIDDGLEGFPLLLARVWDEARKRGLGVSAATLANLAELGVAGAGERRDG